MIAALRERARDGFDSLWRAIQLVWVSSRRWTIASACLILLQSLSPVLILYFTGEMIDAVAAAIEVGGGSAAEVNAIVGLVLLVGGVTFFNVALGTLGTLITQGQQLAVADHVLTTIHAKSIEIGLEYYENQQFYDHLHRVQAEAPFRPQQIVNNLLQTIRDGLTLVGIAGLLLALSLWTPLLLFASGIPILFVRMRFARQMLEWRRRTSEVERRTNYLNILITYEGFAKELRLFGLGGFFSARFQSLRARLRRERLRLVSRQVLIELVIQIVTVAALFGALYVIIGDALQGRLSIGELVVAFQAFQRGQNTFQSLLGRLGQIYEHTIFLRDYQQFLGLNVNIRSPEQPQPIPNPIQRGVCFENVSFHYSQRETLVLDGVNLTIKPGEIIALVGENGAGKTTLVKLLCRLYDPTAGRITIDGIDLRDFDVAALRRALTVQFQDYSRFQTTAWENIWLGNIELSADDKPATDAAITGAARAAGADEIIAELADGYQTVLGNYFGGQELSVGQWQKIALARAFVRDTQLIVLDEPTSALDVLSEQAVFDRFRQIVAGRSGIIISHRLSTVKMADTIYVLDDGRIAEHGTHDLLLAQDGLYAHLYRTQAQHYRQD
ncbi:MAG: ABC transporter ATP-binding protein [Chloroflexi bacterium]|nr:ABC transporter ATP-binding protein [Chloroflexota bacterium]